MQIQQLKYLIAAAEYGSFRAAAQKLYISQSSISVGIKDLEQELGVRAFDRTPRGIVLTPEGAELVERARNAIEQIEFIENSRNRAARPETTRLAVSSQHYSLVVDAFGDFAAGHGESPCEFALRESYTNEIIRDVHESRSDLGIIYLSNYNDRVIKRALSSAELVFTSLYTATPHIIVCRDHPLAAEARVIPDDLDGYYRFEQEQGLESSSYFAEEPLASVPHSRRLVVSDNGTLTTLLARTDGYALGTGTFLPGSGNLVAVPIECDEVMDIGFVRRSDAATSPLVEEFLDLLCARIAAFDGPLAPSPFTRTRTLGPEG